MSGADWWSTSVSRIEPDVIEFRGYPVQELIGRTSFAEVAALLVLGELPTPGRAELLEAALVAPADHGPQAPSIAAARMASTCGVGLNSAIATGVGMLGDTHGGAGQQCVALLQRMRADVLDGDDVAAVAREVVAEHRERKAFVPGFGHRFHTRDPRRDPLLGLVQQAVERGDVEGGYLACALALEAALAEGRQRPVPMNIDGATAVIYAELGCAPELARGFFVLSRSIGILAHAWEESGSGRRIKGPMAPPATAPYTGPDTRHLP